MAIPNNVRVISCAITGSIHTPTMSPYLPITQDEIAENALMAASAGAAAVHIHVRNPQNGMPSSDLNIYREVIEKIRAKNTDVIICLTTGGGAGMTVEQRMAVVPEFKPELASMNSGSINWGLFGLSEKIKEWKYPWEPQMMALTRNYIFDNTFESMMKMVTAMEASGTKPELEAYDIGHIYNIAFLIKQGLIKLPVYIQFVTGILGGIQSNYYDIYHMYETAEKVIGKGNYVWSVIGAGKSQFPATTQSLLMGGNVRVGMEDNLYLSKGVLAKNNGELVEKMVRIMKEFDLRPATPDEAREILGIKKN